MTGRNIKLSDNMDENLEKELKPIEDKEKKNIERELYFLGNHAPLTRYPALERSLGEHLTRLNKECYDVKDYMLRFNALVKKRRGVIYFKELGDTNEN